MTVSWIGLLLALSVIGYGLVAGLFLTFSDFVMRSLRLASGHSGIEIMQIINREIYRSINMVLLWGMVVLSLVAGALATTSLMPASVSMYVFAGSVSYLVGMLLVTGVVNVPMNNQLVS